MSEKRTEDLCAFMDGELSSEEARFLIRRMGNDPHLLSRWKRFHLSREVIRGTRPLHLDGLAERISSAVGQETIEEHTDAPGQSSRGGPGWLRPIAGMAVAASVALVAFSAFQTPPQMAEPSASIPAGLADLEPSDGGMPTSPSLRANLASSGSEAWGNPRLQAYMLRHNEVAAPRRSRGLVPYVYMVSAQPARQDADPEAEDPSTEEQPQQPPRAATGN
jgi:sigma-E factor negative regulatory protein RseA